MLPTPQKRTGPEFLDRPGSYAKEELAGTLADIRLINRYLGDQRALLKHLAGQAKGRASFTLLDIATGSADLAVAIAEWARKAGIDATITGIDINEQTVELARRETKGYPEIEVMVADALNLPFENDSFDYVICSKTFHHLDDQGATLLLREMFRVGRDGYLVMDLRRSWIAWFLISLLARVFSRNRLTRYDGPLSVLKSFTPAELAALAREAGAERFSVTREPFWLLVLAGELK